MALPLLLHRYWDYIDYGETMRPTSTVRGELHVLSGFFVPPYTCKYQFYAWGNDFLRVELSSTPFSTMWYIMDPGCLSRQPTRKWWIALIVLPATNLNPLSVICMVKVDNQTPICIICIVFLSRYTSIHSDFHDILWGVSRPARRKQWKAL